MLQVEELNTTHALYQHRGEWDALVASSTEATIFHTFEWVITWLECFWSQGPLACLLLRDGQQLVAIVPLLWDPGGELWCSGSVVAPVNEHAHRTAVIHDSRAVKLTQVFATVLGHLQRSRPGPLRLVLQELPAAGGAPEALSQAAHQQQLALHTMAGSSAPVVELGGGWERYLRGRSRHVRSELRRKRRKLERAGQLRWLEVNSCEQCDAALEDVFHIERLSWKQRNRSAFCCRPSLSLFYRELARRCARRGWLCLQLLYLDDAPIAHIYGLRFGPQQYLLKTSYDEGHRKLSPGAVLFGHVLEQAAGQGAESVDLLGVSARWKRELLTSYRHHQHACCFSGTQLRCQACRLYRGQLVPLVKQRMPGVVRGKRRVQRALGRVGTLL